ncbi:hypothetical protein PAAG_03234 [Paracoccidioides lutzii Pb01]|uniref:BTB domain-containing protein n=1 Tax=Paracoccidioides lutzii (strain ATCC MYA-826 / Pb01) TaxID=502779 RepID=C1GXV1_PARBA|nr:hypothetical protein PAAG_03234 [Paracoccidioides lutzii Pb01]EEH41671.1 hypothetical protein PAAG_03234 [Paracoccidioides lutzii Pb01]
MEWTNNLTCSTNGGGDGDWDASVPWSVHKTLGSFQRAVIGDQSFPSAKANVNPNLGGWYPLDDLQISLASLYQNKKYTDLTVVAGSEAFQVHRSIVCPRSAFFAAACDGNFHEASSGVINLNEDPVLVQKMIEFLYTLQYSIPTSASESYVEASAAETAPDNGKLATKQPQPEQVVHKAANTSKNKNRHKKKIKDKEKAAYTEHSTSSKQASDNSPSHWDLVSLHIMMYALGNRLMIEGLKSYAKELFEWKLNSPTGLKQIPRAIAEIYSSTPEHDRELKGLVVAIAAKKTARSQACDTGK